MTTLVMIRCKRRARAHRRRRDTGLYTFEGRNCTGDSAAVAGVVDSVDAAAAADSAAAALRVGGHACGRSGGCAGCRCAVCPCLTAMCSPPELKVRRSYR